MFQACNCGAVNTIHETITEHVDAFNVFVVHTVRIVITEKCLILLGGRRSFKACLLCITTCII